MGRVRMNILLDLNSQTLERKSTLSSCHLYVQIHLYITSQLHVTIPKTYSTGNCLSSQLGRDRPSPVQELHGSVRGCIFSMFYNIFGIRFSIENVMDRLSFSQFFTQLPHFFWPIRPGSDSRNSSYRGHGQTFFCGVLAKRWIARNQESFVRVQKCLKIKQNEIGMYMEFK